MRSAIREVAASFGFGNEGAELALAALHGVLLDLLDRASDFTGIGRLDFSQKRLCQQGALGRVFDNFHGVAGPAGGQCLERRKCAKMLKPCWLLSKSLSGEPTRVPIFGVIDGQRAEQNPLNLRERGRAHFHVIAAAEGCLPEFFAKDGGVNPELLGGVAGELIAGEFLRHAPDVGQKVVHGLDLLVGAGSGEHLAGSLDEEVGLAA